MAILSGLARTYPGLGSLLKGVGVEREKDYPMKKVTLTRLFSILLLFLLVQGGSCGSTKFVYRKIRPQRDGLKKRVLVLPVIDQAGVGEAKTAEITASLVRLLNETHRFILHEVNNPKPSTQDMRSPEFGIAVDPQLAKRAEKMGMNTLITAVLNPIELRSKKGGIWPFRRVREEAEISLLVNAVDTINGTLILTNLVSRKTRLPEDETEIQPPGKGKVDDDTLKEVLSDLLEEQVTALTNALENQPWRGRVVSADTDSVTINAGSDVGLTTGSVFEVFQIGDQIPSAGGKSLYLLGPKVGEIKTSQVMESQSNAIPVNGGKFQEGQVIMIKH
jgi:hypothetical protein